MIGSYQKRDGDLIWTDHVICAPISVVSTATIENTLTVTTAGTGSGNVTSSPSGINCGAVCSANLSGSVTLTATQSTGSSFDGWSGGGCSGTGTCNVSVNQAQAVTATFSSLTNHQLSVTVSGSGYGTVTSGPPGISCWNAVTLGGTPSCSASLQGTVLLTAHANTGSFFGGWGSECSGNNTMCSVNMNQVRSVTASFVP